MGNIHQQYHNCFASIESQQIGQMPFHTGQSQPLISMQIHQPHYEHNENDLKAQGQKTDRTNIHESHQKVKKIPDKISQYIEKGLKKTQYMLFSKEQTDGFYPTEVIKLEDDSQVPQLYRNGNTIQQQEFQLELNSADGENQAQNQNPEHEYLIDRRQPAPFSKQTQFYEYPYNAIGSIWMTWQRDGKQIKQAFGTAVLIGKNTIMTAAHNVYNKFLDMQATEVYFFPGVRGAKACKIIQVLKPFYYADQYKMLSSDQSHEYDFAVLQLQHPDLSIQHGYFGINTRWKNQSDQQINVYGYSGDKQTKDKNNNRLKFQYGAKSYLKQKDQNFFYYNIYTAKGQSGSPIFIRKNQRVYQIIGIHVNKNKQKKLNCGIILNERVRKMVNRWVGKITKLLNLMNCGIKLQQLKLIAESDDWKDLIGLNLSVNNLKDQGVRQLMEYSKAFKNITNLNLSLNGLSDQAMEFLVKQNYFPELKQLHLHSNQFTHQGVKTLTRNVKIYNKLQVLSLYSNKLGPQSTKFFADQNTFPYLSKLFLGWNNVGTLGFQYLTRNQLLFCNLTQLYLSCNNIGPEGMKYLAQNPSLFFKLNKLILWQNHIGDQGVKYLTKDPTIFKNLDKLNLDQNQIGPQGIKHLFKDQRLFWRMGQLKLYGNHFGDQGMQYMTQNPDTFRYINDLYLYQNNITIKGIRCLLKHKKLFKDVKVLKLQFNQVNEQDKFKLMKQLQQKFTKCKIYL